MVRLFLLFVLVPMADLALLLMIGRWNWWLSLVIVIASGFLGALLVRLQGASVMGKMRRSVAQGQMPTDALIQGVLVLIAAALLITPGLMTDLFGLTLLIPPCRRFYLRRFVKWLQARVQVETISLRAMQGDVVDGEFSQKKNSDSL